MIEYACSRIADEAAPDAASCQRSHDYHTGSVCPRECRQQLVSTARELMHGVIRDVTLSGKRVQLASMLVANLPVELVDR